MHLLPNVFRTEGDIVKFDPSKIFDSIIKETGLNEEDTKHITELAVRRIISSGIKFLSGPHIREIVCSILSEQHFEQERKLYTRIGMPLMDYEKILEKGPKNKLNETINPEKIHHWAANQIAEEYTLLRILSDEESKAHLYGDIHVHKLRYFDLRPLSQIWDPRLILKNGLPPVSNYPLCCKAGPASNLRTAIHHLIQWLGMVHGEFSGIQGYEFINVFLAPYAKGLNDREIKHEIRNLVYEINQLSAVIGRKIPLTSISCCPTIINEFSKLPATGTHGKNIGVYGDYDDECLKIFNALTEIFKEGDYSEKAFEFPKHFILFNEKWLNEYENAYSKVWEEILRMKTPYLVNSCSNWIKNKINKRISLDSLNYGMLQNISLNLPRYAFMVKDENKFMEILGEMMDLSFGILIKKYNIIKRRLNTRHLPLCSCLIENKPLFELDKQDLSINFVGLNEAVKFLTGYELHEDSDSFNFGKKIVKEMNQICVQASERINKKFVLKEYLSETLKYRFAKLDLKHFPKIAISQKNKIGDYYTNSAHFQKHADMYLLENIKKQGKFHPLIQNSILQNISVDDIEKEYKNLREFVKIICSSSDIACLKFV